VALAFAAVGGPVRDGLRDLAGSTLWALGPTRPARAGRDCLTVVTFHRVLPEDLRATYAFPGLVVTPAELDWFVAFFGRHYTVDTLAAALARWRQAEPVDRPLLAITFDDGQVDNFAYARPVLDKLGLRATFFVASTHVEAGTPLWHDRLGLAVRAAVERRLPELARLLRELSVDAEGEGVPNTIASALASRAKVLSSAERQELIARVEQIAGSPSPPSWDGIMSWDQLRALARAGHEIGSHSMSHPILPLCSDSDLEREVAGSKAVLEDRLQLEIASFCYPNGDCDPRVADAVHRAGYRQAVRAAGGPNRRGTSLLELGRCDLVATNCLASDGRLSEPRLAWRLSGLYPGAR
jgi:peptidoglycan/xylan/chitin deacetylase (PgdA/CDA1 family)